MAGNKIYRLRSPADRTRCYHAIVADCVGVELKRQLDVAVAKQGLYSLWIGSDSDEK